MTPWKNTNVWAGAGTLIRNSDTIICMARIMPQSSCIDPPKIKDTKKFPYETRLKIMPPFSVAEFKFLASFSLIITGIDF
jgi:hypothetical protein